MIKKAILGVSAVALIGLGTVEAASIGGRLFADFISSAKLAVQKKFAVYYPLEVEKTVYAEPSLETVVSSVSAEQGIPKDLIYAIIDVESSGGRNLTRFEPRKYNQDNQQQAEFEKIMKNSSHGVMQVMGYNAKGCGLTWQDLYKTRLGVECGTKILRDCLERAKALRPSDQITQALGCYNGDPEKYPQKVKAALIDRLIGQGKLSLAMNLK